MDSIIKINELPILVLINIFSFIRKTNDYKSIRSVCKRFHKLLPNVMAFDCFGTNIKTVYIKEGKVKKIEHIYRNIFYSDKYYLARVIQIQNNKKNGFDVSFDENGNIMKKISYKNGLYNGPTTYFKNLKPSQIINYKNGLKHDYEHLFIKKKKIIIEKKYAYGILLLFTKYERNNKLIESQFLNKNLNGITKLFFNYNYNNYSDRYGIKSILDFKNGMLFGESKITQFDRVLHLNFKDGLLNGIQMVFSLDNKLTFLARYRNGELNGKYTIYDNDKKVEYGNIYRGLPNGEIVTFKKDLGLCINYNFEYGRLNGEYKEIFDDKRTITILYKNNKFAGKFIYKDEEFNIRTEITIYNDNNFEYRRYESGISSVSFIKKYDSYTLTTINLTNLKTAYKSNNGIVNLNLTMDGTGTINSNSNYDSNSNNSSSTGRFNRKSNRISNAFDINNYYKNY